ncbi:T9SS type A sorting domain-containing protein [Carboxylicivirga marina]|uniref:T9SS type A sorting domain-containing protein n=1 Tax=Carboxylicivirga marina TaxID=2800988 RepID=UPI0025991500|nr:T9SS type A sorting domain-containing protein [uncultured Carboxylicivirga sp.]
MKFYQTKKPNPLKHGILVALLCISAISITNAQECNDCFSTEVIQVIQDETCLHIELRISASECAQALSHYTVEIPCGRVTEATNSMNWPMELNSADPTTNISGLKVDETEGFGEDGQTSLFTLNYTICTNDENCTNELLTQSFIVGYKTGTCVFTDKIVLQDKKLEANLLSTPLNCFGAENGSIDLTVINGTPPYQFLWNNGATTEDIEGLSAGLYSVTISDANGETLTLESEITEPTAINVTATITHANCGSYDGSLHLAVTGGTEPYTISWNTGQTGVNLNNISGGQYTAVIEDVVGCQKTMNFNVVNQSDLRATISTSTIECYEEGTGTLTVTANGGTPPYSYLWNNGETIMTASKLNSGSHKVTITDANGCSITKTGYVVAKKISVDHSLTEPQCNGDNSGAISLTITNGTEPYQIVWNNGESTSTINNLTGGWYWADITDANGCTAREYVKVSEPNEISINTSVKRASCQEADSSIIVSVTGAGGTPPYDIYYDAVLVDGPLIVDKEGYYEFKAIDANGCSITESVFIGRPEAGLDFSVLIQQPDCQQASGSAQITINGGIEPYSIEWSDGYNDLSRNNLTAGDYLITIEDANGCSSSQTITIHEAVHPSVVLIEPTSVICGSTDNVINAHMDNSEQFSWSITNADETWYIQDEQATQLIYTAGIGSATFNIEVRSSSGCIASDSITINCSDSNNDTGGSGGEDNDDINTIEECENTCFDISPLNMYQTYDGCYTYHAIVTTDGACRYELSHLTIEVLNGSVSVVKNSNNWVTELNNTDPTSSLYGFKIDDISDFGKKPDTFDLSFNICPQTGTAQTEFRVAYKAAQCLMYDTLTFESKDELTAKTYPNPFIDKTNIEFTSQYDADAIVNIYGINGELIDCLYKGSVEAGTTYNFDFRSQSTESNIYFYRIICGKQSVQGKIIQTVR